MRLLLRPFGSLPDARTTTVLGNKLNVLAAKAIPNGGFGPGRELPNEAAFLSGDEEWRIIQSPPRGRLRGKCGEM
jgi:hypothetical protein